MEIFCSIECDFGGKSFESNYRSGGHEDDGHGLVFSEVMLTVVTSSVRSAFEASESSGS